MHATRRQTFRGGKRRRHGGKFSFPWVFGVGNSLSLVNIARQNREKGDGETRDLESRSSSQVDDADIDRRGKFYKLMACSFFALYSFLLE